jgi:hypothetical protein
MTTTFVPLGITNLYHPARPLNPGLRAERKTFRGPIVAPQQETERQLAFGLQTVSGGQARYGARWRGGTRLFGNRLNYLA